MLSILCIILDIIIHARNIIPVESIETEAGEGGRLVGRGINPEKLGEGGLVERGKTGGHEPPQFPLPCHTLSFFSSGTH